MGDLRHIHEHPEYRCYMEPSEEEEIEMNASLALLEKEEPPPVPRDGPPVGNNVCFLCQHRQDKRAWWKRWLFRADASHYVCRLFERDPVENPVTGQQEYLEKLKGILGPQWALTRERFRSCLEINPEGRCPFFQVALKERRLRRERG